MESNNLVIKLSTLITNRGWGLWALEEISSERFIGFAGLHCVPEELSFSPAIEIGWRLSRIYWGKGYATEAAKKVLEFAFNELNLDEVVSFTSVTNQQSQRVMERINMVNSNCNFLHPKISAQSVLQEHVLYKISNIQ